MEKQNYNLKQEINDLCSIEDNEENSLGTLRTIKEELIFRKQFEKFRFYEPNGKCEEFIQKVGEINDKGKHNFIVLFSAANGVGKTCVSANIVAHILWGAESENPYFDYPLFKDFPFPKRGRIISDPENLKSNLIPTLKEWLPEGRYKTTKASKQYESIWKTDNGWEFDIMSYEQDPKEFESTTLGWAWFDEPPTESIFKATVSRMRKGGIIFISETPLYAAWLYDHVIANADKDLASKGQRVYIEAGVEAACKEHGIRGHLEHDHIQTMIAEYSEDEKQARVHGKFQHLVGLRFKQFSRDIHVIKPFEINYRDFTVYHALDTHPRVPDAGIWIAVDRKGTKYVIDELFDDGIIGTEELAQRIKSKNDQYRVEHKILEPAAFIEDQHATIPGMTLAKKLQSYGLSYLPAPKQRSMSNKRIEDALNYQKVNLKGVEEFHKTPELYFFDTCRQAIWEMEHWRWDEWTGKTADKKGKKETTVDKDDHLIEDIGRIMILEPTFIEAENKHSGPVEPPSYDPY